MTKKTLADFKAAHDKSFIVPQKIKAGIDALGKDGWEYEAEFIKSSGVNQNDISKFREQFTDFVVLIRQDGREKRVWAGSKTLADKLREML